MIKFYIISTVITIIIVLINSLATSARLKREGYKRNYESSVFEFLQSCIFLFIPILNISTALVMQFKHEEVYETIKKKWMKVEGDING